MKLVVIESPFAGQVERNVAYARKAMLFALSKGAAPFASHLLYTQVLDDNDHGERMAGITAGLAWGAKADETWVFQDYGISGGMAQGINEANRVGRPVHYFTIGPV